MENIRQLFNTGSFTGDHSRNTRLRVMNFVNNRDSGDPGAIRVCTLVDWYCENSSEGHALYEKLVKVINDKPDDGAAARFDYEFIDKDSKARFTLFGNPDYIIKTLEML